MQRVAGSMRNFLLFVLLLTGVVVLSSCGDVTEEEAILNYETILALTPTSTPTFTPTPSPTLTPSPTPIPSPTPTVTPTRPPTPTPPPPTPTPDPALKGFSFCNQVVGEQESGRFSARVANEITTQQFPAYERLTIPFEMADESAPLSAVSMLLHERDYTLITGDPMAPAAYMLMVGFPGWLHDAFFTSSVLTGTNWMSETATLFPTFALSNTQVMKNISVLADEESAAGMFFMLALDRPALYHLTASSDASELRVEVARGVAWEESNNTLSTQSGNSVELPAPLYFVQAGDIWRIDDTGVISLTATPEEVTDIAVSDDGSLLAFCRTQEPGVHPLESGAAVPGSLWLMRMDEDEEPQRIADTGVNCDDLAFSPDASLLAMSIDETGISPTERSIKIIPVAGETAMTQTVAISATVQEPEAESDLLVRGGGWNRFTPQWLDNTRLVYTASAPDTRSTIFLLDLASGIEHDVGGDIQVVDKRYRYSAFGPPLVSPDGRAFAVEAVRADEPGADLLVLDATGQEQDVIHKDYWSRPLAWTENNSLYYLVRECNSALVQSYDLYVREGGGSVRLLTSGASPGMIGDAVAVGDGLAYVAANRAVSDVTGDYVVSPFSPSSLWYWDFAAGGRGKLYEARRGITQLVR